MKRLSEHILSLLRSYDKVAIPGIGFFSLEYHQAYLDFETLTFNPPHFSLSFYKDSNISDPMLEDSYKHHEGLSDVEANSALHSDLESFKSDLNEKGTVFLPELGTFIAEGDNLYFDSQLCFNSALPSLSFENEQVMDKLEIPVAEETPIENRESVIPEGYHYHKPHYYYIPIHKTVANIAACLFLVLIVALATVFPFSQPQAPSSAAYITPVKIVENNSLPSSNLEIAEKNEIQNVTDKAEPSLEEESLENITKKEEQTQPVAQVAKKAEMQKIPEIDADQNSKAKYYAVIGAFKTMKRVEVYLKQQAGNGYSLEVVTNGKQKLITAASAETLAEMQKKLMKIRQDYPDAWVFEKK